MSIENPQFNRLEEDPMLKEVNLKDLRKGDKVVVETKNDKDIEIYEITLLGRERGSANVKLKITRYRASDPEHPKVEELTARMPGGFEMNRVEDIGNDRVITKEGAGIIKDTIKAGGEYTLYFENIKDLDGEPSAGKMRSAPVSKIVEVNKQEKE